MTIHRRRVTALVAVITLVAALVTIVGAANAPAQAQRSQQRAMSAGTYESQVHALINRQRTNRGLRPLSLNSCTDGFSERWSRYLARTGRFHHQDLGPIFRQCRARYAGEVIGRGHWGPEQVVNAWMHSPTHRRILLKPAPNRLGVGAVRDSRGRWVLTANTTRVG